MNPNGRSTMGENHHENERIGVFICDCAGTIREAVDVPETVRMASRLEGVVRAEHLPLACTPEAGDRIIAAIRTDAITRVVVAGCSPTEHEATFRNRIAAAGLNPFMLQTANIREGCAWVIPDGDQATRKAADLIRAAVQRVRHHLPLAHREIDVQADVLVVGGGVAGLAAAQTLVQQGRRVFLVERAPCLGGQVALYADLTPDHNCAACLLDPVLDTVLHDEHITVMTLGEVRAVHGFDGNFSVTIVQHPRLVDAQDCIGCGACLPVCPVKVPDPANAGRNQRAAIYIPYTGALPHLAAIDRQACLRFHGEACSRCKDACPVAAINFEQTGSTQVLTVGAVIVATGFTGFNPGRAPRYGNGSAGNIITGFAFERLVNASGPTDGRIVAADGRPPARVAIIHCVGSRSEDFNPYCSGVCCGVSVKHARQIKDQLPDAHVHLLFSDLCLPGKIAQSSFESLQAMPGVHLHRVSRMDTLHIHSRNGTPVVRYTTGRPEVLEVDLVILATAMEAPADTAAMATCLDIERDERGFFKEAHSILEPVASSREGIYLAGCCQGPKDIAASVAQGQAAAGRILQRLVPGAKRVLDPRVARVDGEICSGCRTCASICPFGAMGNDPQNGGTVVQEILCRGCGICVAACPSGAITVGHFESDAVNAEIDGLLGCRDRMPDAR